MKLSDLDKVSELRDKLRKIRNQKDFYRNHPGSLFELVPFCGVNPGSEIQIVIEPADAYSPLWDLLNDEEGKVLRLLKDLGVKVDEDW